MAKSRRFQRSVIFPCVLALILILQFKSSGATEGAVTIASGGRNLVMMVLRAAGPARLGASTELIAEATPAVDTPDLRVVWELPVGVSLRGSIEEYFGPVMAGETVTSRRSVSFVTEGVHKVVAAAAFDLSPEARFGASGVLFFTVGRFSASVTDKDPTAISPMHSIVATDVTSSPFQSGQRNSSDDPCFSISGTLVRIERPPALNGYDANQIVPVRNAWVEVREEDDFFDDSYLDLHTDNNGSFSGSFCDDDGVANDTLEIYIQVHAEIHVDGYLVAEVEDSSWIDETYIFNTSPKSSDGGNLTFNMSLNLDQSAVFNIADAVLDAWLVWRDSGGENGGDSVHEAEGEVHWEPGYGDTGSYYDPFWDEITIADHPNDPDVWDDSVIMHEWGHMADDTYSCDDNPGGQHSFGQLLSTELAWGEGYPDFWQSAVKLLRGRPNPSFYIDMNGAEMPGRAISLENFSAQQPALVSVRNEMAIAATFWDFIDSSNDGADTILHGQPMLQEVYTGGSFQSIAEGVFDDTCDFDSFMRAWVAAGKPADAATAAVVMQNSGYTLSPSSAVARGPAAVTALEALNPIGPWDGVWWNRVTYVVDNSKSMAGPKFEAVKEVLDEAIHDQAQEPEGTEFKLETFNNTSFANQEVFAGQFFAIELSPAVQGLSTSAANDAGCDVWGLNALNRAILDQFGGLAWLFTDGDTVQNPSVDNLVKNLNDRGVRASVALMGVCPALDRAMDRRAEVQLEGGMERALGTKADVPGGVVPYLLTAINSGGQFLYVDATQAEKAADILRAQLTHSAGAGTWSDYVSDSATYLYDELASWEYNWVDAAGTGTDHGTPAGGSFKLISMPEAFPFYGITGANYHLARAYENGYITIGNYTGNAAANTALPNAAAPNNVLYPYWDELDYQLLCGRDAEACGLTGHIYSKAQRSWFVIEQKNYFSGIGGSNPYMDFQTQLNLVNGEIRFLYGDMGGFGAPSATVGLENSLGNSAVQISFDTKAGVDDEMGYKFVPAPPQPTKTYTVPVDALMGGVAFLLTGYDGSFEDLLVKYPNGSAVSCADTDNVLCLDLGLVQYVQADVDGRYGDWTAIVDAGPTGSGTFSLFSMAASAISVENLSDHQLGITAALLLQIDLGMPLPSNSLTGHFVTPDDEPFGGPFNFYDNGVHGDGLAGDGVFGSDDYVPPGAGTAYLRVTGQISGTTFVRSDPVPYTFQPISLESQGDGANFGGATELNFVLTNQDIFEHTYFLESTVPAGWGIDGVFGFWTLGPGESMNILVYITMGSGPNNLPSGTSGVVTLTAVEAEKGVMTDSTSATVTRRRAPDEIIIFNPIDFLKPGGDSGELEVTVLDDQGVAVADGTEVQMSATLGAVEPAVGIIQSGHFYMDFITGNQKGTATITASIGGLTTSTEIEVMDAPPDAIVLEVSEPNLPADGVSTAILVARLTNRYGDPVAGQMVRIGVEGDGQMGSVGNGMEVAEGVTNEQGEFSTIFTAGEIVGEVGVRAELLIEEDGGVQVVLDDRQEINLGGGVMLFMPMIRAD